MDQILPDVRSAFQRLINPNASKAHNIAYFMSAHALHDGASRGRLYFFPCRNARNLFQELKRDLIQVADTARFNSAEGFLATRSEVRGLGKLTCAFTLLKNGKVFIENDQGIRQDVFETVARHLYFFIKDGVHKHYHHHGESDGILEVVPTSQADWRGVVKRNLHDKIITLRHIQDAESLSNALGVLAYYKSFIRIFGAKDYDATGANIPNITSIANLNDEIEASIRLRLDAVVTNDGKRYSDASFGIGIIVAIIGIIFSWLQIADKESRLLQYISGRSSIDVALGTFVLGIGLWTLFDVASRKRDFNKSKVVTSIYRLLSPLNKTTHMLLVILFIAFMVMLAYSTASLLFLQFPIEVK